MTRKRVNSWRAGLLQSVPIILGYIPVGIAFGVLSLEVGVSPLNTLLMSAMVLGAASQLVAIQLLTLDTSPVVIVTTIFVVNLRHMLFSSAIGPYLKGWRWYEIAFFAYGLTDEAFALHTRKFKKKDLDKTEAITINAIAHGSWILGTCLGIIIGSSLQKIEFLDLEYALPAMFIALLLILARTWLSLFIALLAGTIATLTLITGMNYWNLILATIICSTLGLIVELWNKKKYSL
ncbi:MAG: branched-chain amino acid ABC transporter permease [Symploca sp. SIO2B6]|nr:branched-chain amino acid ABC transporter permease [Symploca sp. SIO2B6]